MRRWAYQHGRKRISFSKYRIRAEFLFHLQVLR